jgi:hypothetical protein
LDSKNLLVKESHNEILEIKKILEHLRLVLEKIDPSEFAKIINEANIVFISTNGLTGRTPYIRKNQLQRSFRPTKR